MGGSGCGVQVSLQHRSVSDPAGLFDHRYADRFPNPHNDDGGIN